MAASREERERRAREGAAQAAAVDDLARGGSEAARGREGLTGQFCCFLIVFSFFKIF